LRSSLNSVYRVSKRAIAMSTEAIWVLAERTSGEHIAQLYPHEAVLIESLRTFTTDGLLRREGVLLVLTPSHRQVLLRHLNAEGVDVEELQRAGQLLLPDAEELLASFMCGRMPDATLFSRTLGEVLARMRPNGGNRKVRVFGEMVDLLWKSNQPAAICLEQLWRDLIESSGLSLFCAHSTSHIHDTFPETLRAPHLHIISSAITETTADAIVGYTLDPRIVYWNQGATGIYGYALEDVIGQPSSMLTPYGHSELPAVIERIRRGEHVPHYETRRKRKDGTVIDVSVAVSPVKTGDGELLGVSVVARDVSARKRGDEASARSAAIVDSSEDAIIGEALDATIVSWNRGAERTYGYTTTEAIGRPIGMLLPPGCGDPEPAMMARIRRGEEVPRFETKRQRKDGAIIDVSVTVSPIRTPDGDVIGASAIARDITERKGADAAQTQIARLEQFQAAHRLLLERVFEAEEHRRRIARELHDEAGQLMASVLVGLRALDDSRSFGEAKAQAQRLREIVVKAIDELGRLARGLHSSVLDDHGLRVALERYVADYSTTRNIAVNLALDELDLDLPPAVQLAVFRIIQEALTNVARHAAASRICIRVARSATGLETTVADNGHGFDAEAAGLHSEVHLGLQSMRERAAILGGTVGVTSGPTGTTISVHIPLASGDSQAQSGAKKG
jgi:PAS domain S-box-containing protein